MLGSLFAIPSTLLEELKQSPAARKEWLGDTSELDAHDLGKDWHALHYLLCGSAEGAPGPLGQAVLGGEPLSSDDMGYGPARFLLPEEVKAIAKALARVSAVDLKERFEPAKMDTLGIYPNQWEREGEGTLTELVARFDRLKSYYTRAAKAGLAMLGWLS